MIERLIVTVHPDGRVEASTSGMLGTKCLDSVSLLEDMLEAVATQSAYTGDFTRAADESYIDDLDQERDHG